MAFKKHNMLAVVEEKVEERKTAAPAVKPNTFRSKRGNYTGRIINAEKKELGDRGCINMRMDLHNEAGKRVGTAFPTISWVEVEKEPGKLDLKSRLWGETVRALGIPSSETIEGIVQGLPESVLDVYVTEYFKVPVADLYTDAERQEALSFSDKRTLETVVFSFINDDDEGEEKAKAYLKAGYRSQAMVLSIRAVR